jgi:hypothetical protein
MTIARWRIDAMNLIAGAKAIASALSKAAGRTRVARAGNPWTRLAVVWCVTFALLPVTLVDSTAAADTDISFNIGSAVSTEDASYVTEGVAMAKDYVSLTLSEVSEPLVINVRSTDDTTGGGAVAFYGGNYIVVFTGSPGWVALSPFDRLHVVVHEYIHAWQHQSLGADGPTLPAWFIEGMAEYLSYDAISRQGLVRPQAVRDYHAWSVQSARDLAGLEELADRSAFYTEHGPVYSLAYLAIARLLGDESPDLLDKFIDRIRLGQKSESAFNSVFGQDLQSFYRSFAIYRRDFISPVRVPEPFISVLPIAVEGTVRIVSAPDSAAPGEQLLVLGRSEAGAICRFTLADSGASENAAGSTFADASGQFFWLVTVPPTIRSGPVDVTADCGGEQITVEIEITNEH